MMIVMIAMLALALDVGQIQLARSELARSVDAAALAGAGALVDGEDAARDATVEYLVRNPMGRFHLVANNDELLERKEEFLTKYAEQLQLNMGHWDPETHAFQVSDVNPSAVQVAMRYPDRPLFFAKALGFESFAVEAQAIAVFQPRDIMLVLDFSASMNDDSELSAIGQLGQDRVVDNIEQMWSDLGSPTYGRMGFEPDWVTVPGATLPVDRTMARNGSGRDLADQSAATEAVSFRRLVHDDQHDGQIGHVFVFRQPDLQVQRQDGRAVGDDRFLQQQPHPEGTGVRRSTLSVVGQLE